MVQQVFNGFPKARFSKSAAIFHETLNDGHVCLKAHRGCELHETEGRFVVLLVIQIAWNATHFHQPSIHAPRSREFEASRITKMLFHALRSQGTCHACIHPPRSSCICLLKHQFQHACETSLRIISLLCCRR